MMTYRGVAVEPQDEMVTFSYWDYMCERWRSFQMKKSQVDDEAIAKLSELFGPSEDEIRAQLGK